MTEPTQPDRENVDDIPLLDSSKSGKPINRGKRKSVAHVFNPSPDRKLMNADPNGPTQVS